jgi:hypothetical protein
MEACVHEYELLDVDPWQDNLEGIKQIMEILE